MKYSQIQGFCKRQGIKLPLNWFAYYNRVCRHDKRETSRHFLYKAGLVFKLTSMGQTVFTEFKFNYPGRFGKAMKFPTCDVFWLDELEVIELESNPTEATTKLKYEQYKKLNCFVFDIGKTSLKEIMEKIGLTVKQGEIFPNSNI